MRRTAPTLVFALLLAAAVARAQVPAIDPTFGVGGSFAIQINSTSQSVTDALLLPGDRFLVCGATNTGSTMYVARFLPNGFLDSTFAVHGIAMVSFSNPLSGPVAIARQAADGKIVLAGATLGSGTFATVLARLDSTGALDTGTFGTLGRVTQALGTAGDTQDLLVQPDGHILVAGSIRTSGTTVFMGLRRYLTSGAVDPSFGIGGTVNRGPGTSNLCFAISLMGDGRIMAVGSTDLGAGAGPEFLTFRFKANGSPDSTFGTFGRVITAVSVFPNFAKAVQVLADGRVLVAGHLGVPANNSKRFAVLRLFADGTSDPTFGSGGLALTPQVGITTGNSFLEDFALEHGGRLLMAGQATNLGSSDDFALARMDSTGAMDNAFGSAGLFYADPSGGGRDLIVRVLRQSSGRLVAVGQIGTGVFVNGPDIGLDGYQDDEVVAAVPRPAGGAPAIALAPAAPNPLREGTRMRFVLREPARVTLRIYDVSGRAMATLAEGDYAAGEQDVRWAARAADGRDAAPGVYLARLEVRGASGVLTSAERKLVVVR